MNKTNIDCGRLGCGSGRASESRKGEGSADSLSFSPARKGRGENRGGHGQVNGSLLGSTLIECYHGASSILVLILVTFSYGLPWHCPKVVVRKSSPLSSLNHYGGHSHSGDDDASPDTLHTVYTSTGNLSFRKAAAFRSPPWITMPLECPSTLAPTPTRTLALMIDW